ncbi:hypothetical protein GCM10009841_25800 [Microlunatus panaciterrae]
MLSFDELPQPAVDPIMYFSHPVNLCRPLARGESLLTPGPCQVVIKVFHSPGLEQPSHDPSGDRSAD